MVFCCHDIWGNVSKKYEGFIGFMMEVFGPGFHVDWFFVFQSRIFGADATRRGKKKALWDNYCLRNALDLFEGQQWSETLIWELVHGHNRRNFHLPNKQKISNSSINSASPSMP